jgi:uncharacterized protein YcfJ
MADITNDASNIEGATGGGVLNATPASLKPVPNLYTPRGTASQFDSGKYDIANFTYPEDLYTNKKEYGGNYAIFYINVSVDSKLITREGATTVSDMTPRDRGDLIAMGLTAAQLTTANAGAGAVEGAIAGGLLAFNLKGGAVGAASGAVAGTLTGGMVTYGQEKIDKNSTPTASRAQKRLKTAIALHIPNNLAINYGVTWSEDDTGMLAMAAAATQQGVELLKAVQGKGDNSDVTGTGAAILTNIALSKGPQGAGNSVATGLAANPKKEQVFKGVNFRTFSFDYKFFPRNSKESQNILNIIKEFKYHMHPEFKDANNFVYIYPSEFDIFYYQNGQENMNLHRHTSCVLTDMNINYTPNGMFNTFDDGMPTQIDVTLSFRELALLTKDKVKDGL